MFSLPSILAFLMLAVAAGLLPDVDDPRQPKPTAADVEAVAKESADLAKQLDKNSDYLFRALRSGDAPTRMSAMLALNRLGTRAIGSYMNETLLYVIKNDPNPKMRADAIRIIRCGDWWGVREGVRDALSDPDIGVRIAAVGWCEHDGGRTDLVVPILAKMMSDSLVVEDSPANSLLRLFIFGALSKYGPQSAPADAALVQTLKARRWEDRREAFITLTRIRRDKSTLVPLFKERFAAKNPADPELWAAAISLHELGPLARQFVPDLVRCLRYGLYTAGQKKFDGYVDYVKSSAYEFERLGPIAKAAAPDLLKFFLDGSLSGSDRAYVLLAYSAIATPNRDELKQIAEGMIGGELSTGSHNDVLVVAVRRLGAAIMPHLAAAWERQITNNYLNRAMLWFCLKLEADAAPLLPMIESFYIEPGQDTGRIPAIARSLNGDARVAAGAIKADIEKRKKAAPKKK